MKLSHLSLAILSGIALTACGGGSDDQVDNTNPGQPTTPTDPTTPTPPEKQPVPVSNEKNALEIDPASAEHVKAAKQIMFQNTSRDSVIGYLPNTNQTYTKGNTDAADILRATSIVNYVDEGQVNQNGVLKLNPLQTYAKGADGNYYRVGSVNGAGRYWSNATESDTFSLVNPSDATGTNGGYGSGNNGGTQIPAEELVYIPNVWTTTGATASSAQTTAATVAYRPTDTQLDGGVAGSTYASSIPSNAQAGVNFINPRNINNSNTINASNVFDVAQEQVDAHTLHFAGKAYDISRLSNTVEIDLSAVPMKQEIQKLPLTIDYTIIDKKSTLTDVDDTKVDRVAKAGEARVYNLNYSRAMVLLNQAAVDTPNSVNANAWNSLGLATGGLGYNGAYQVVGRETGTLPTNGRAVYEGQSFGVNATGDIKLEADFGIDRASIGGSVFNRKTDAGVALPTWKLHDIMLSQPSAYSVTGSSHFNGSAATATVLAPDAAVSSGGVNVGSWAVQLYGANAENAAGLIFDGAGAAQEVFNSARGDISPKSLNN